ncbi:hypothetical protein [Methylobacterium brachythecii]|uniref:Uncharacterized protein n=1 Tax=Methylobacterium brachythecii TaxID=1176177 RepID=A0A7W6AD95_9HYPH|nr:hypothetical protein [Methylobacterium brachythecii]MBB3901118.1 hypothetical protein [Methylobacterium brachythecii]GLS45230.1 hypothetical protein GCM10007884_32190 [Methylobacterium brachythecii]
MKIISWLTDQIRRRKESARSKNLNENRADAIENGTFADESTFGGRDFDEKYRLAMRLTQKYVDQHYPNSYYAKQIKDFDRTLDYEGIRTDAISILSSSICASLRQGAGAEKAASVAIMKI